MALVSIPIQFQCPYSKQDSSSCWDRWVNPIRPPGLQRLFHTRVPHTAARITLANATLTRALLCSKIFRLLCYHNIQSQHSLCHLQDYSTSKSTLPSHCICDTLSLYSPQQPNQCLFGPQTHQMHSYLRPPCFCSSYSHHLEFSFISSLCGLITSRSLALREVHMVYVKKGAAL